MVRPCTCNESIPKKPRLALVQEQGIQWIGEEIAFRHGWVLPTHSHALRIRSYMDDMARACHQQLCEPFEDHARRGLFENYCPETGLFESLEISLIYYLTRKIRQHRLIYERLRCIEATHFPNLQGDTLFYLLAEDEPIWLEKTISH